MQNDEMFMKEAIKEALKAKQLGEVPIGAVIVQNDKIIARGFNQKETNKIAIMHAEIIAINNACKYINDWRLSDCTLYVTVEPCLMCCGAILQSRINRLVYGTYNKKFGYVESIAHVLTSSNNNHKVNITSGILKEECKEIIQEFFLEKRLNYK